MSKSQIARFVCLFSYFGLMVVMTAWYGWIAPPSHFPISLMLLLVVTPLLFGIRGMLNERLYTHAWMSLMALAYIAHGAVEIYSSPAQRWLAITELLLGIGLNLGSGFFVKYRAAELRLQQEAGQSADVSDSAN
jgi:uncharacterized membrane protein